MKSIFTGALTGALSTSIVLAQSSDIQDLGSTSVTGDVSNRLSSLILSEKKIQSLSGGSSLIDSEQWQGQIIKPEEVFQFDPGVYARSTGTANDTRLSVRGSGIQRRFGSRGISLLLDGIPANDSDGSFYFRIIDPQSISHIESFRGGNGLRYGASQLGGAIQIYQKNGISHPGGLFSVEAGSFETYRTHIEQGGQSGKWDWFVGYSYAESDGYRDRQNWESHHFTANLGYHWSDKAVTRFYGLFSDSDGLLSGSLTEAQFQEDPKQSRPGQHPDTDRDLSTIRFGQVTKWTTNSGSWSFSSNYQYLDFDHLTGFGNFAFNNLVDYDTDSFSVGLNGNSDYEFAGYEHTLYTSAAASYGRNRVGGFTGFVRPGVSASINDREDTSTNLKIYFENDTKLGSGHHAIAGLGYIWTERRRTIGSNDQRSSAFKSAQEGLLGKIGYLYDINEHSQFYANVSQSFEAAPFSEAAEADIANPQEALTYEVGTRYQNAWLKSELTVYLAKVNEEFVYEETAPNSGTFAVTNADTTHFGIEAAASVNINELYSLESPVQFDFDLSYQLNDHTFDEGPAADNQIPAISEHVIAARLTASGKRWKTSLSVDWLPEGLIADNNNTLTTAGYAVTDFTAEFKLNESVTLYGGVNNLFDRQYASTVTVNPSANSGYISPGDGRSGFLGLKVAW